MFLTKINKCVFGSSVHERDEEEPTQPNENSQSVFVEKKFKILLKNG